MRTCSKCNRTDSGFYKNSASPDGLRSVCKLCCRKDQSVYRASHKEEKAARGRERWLKNKDQMSKYHRKWSKDNPERKIAICRNYQARKRDQLGFVPTDIKQTLRDLQDNLCHYCQSNLTSDHLEHMTPLSRGGLHDVSNLCLSCPECNLRKGTKTEEEFTGGDVSLVNA